MFSALLHNRFSLLSFIMRICRELQNVWMHCKASVTNVKHSMYYYCLSKRWKIPSKWHTYVCAWNTCMSRAHVQPHLRKSMIWWQDSICITVYNNIFSVIHGSNITLQSNHVSNTYSTYTSQTLNYPSMHTLTIPTVFEGTCSFAVEEPYICQRVWLGQSVPSSTLVDMML